MGMAYIEVAKVEQSEIKERTLFFSFSPSIGKSEIYQPRNRDNAYADADAMLQNAILYQLESSLTSRIPELICYMK